MCIHMNQEQGYYNGSGLDEETWDLISWYSHSLTWLQMMWIYKEDNSKIIYNYYNTLMLIVNRIIKQYNSDPIQDGKMKL